MFFHLICASDYLVAFSCSLGGKLVLGDLLLNKRWLIKLFAGLVRHHNIKFKGPQVLLVIIYNNALSENQILRVASYST